MHPIKVVVADDHKIVRDGIISLLKKYDDVLVVNETDHELKILTTIEQQPVDVLLLDVSIPNVISDQTLQTIKEKFPELKILALSMHDDIVIIEKLYKQGINGYLLKATDTDTIVSAIKKVHHGENYFDQHVVSALMNKVLHQPTAINSKIELTLREIEVVTYIASGLINKEIADKLSISTRTVETHRNNIMKKISARNTADIVRFCITNKLI